jgi:hypothetical protein
VDAIELADAEKRPVAQAYLAAAGRGEARQQLAWAAESASERTHGARSDEHARIQAQRANAVTLNPALRANGKRDAGD